MTHCSGCDQIMPFRAYLRHDCPGNRGLIEPEHPCRVMPTRACPRSYAGQCGDRPCARFESDDETPWLAELTGDAEMPVIPEDEQDVPTTPPPSPDGDGIMTYFCLGCSSLVMLADEAQHAYECPGDSPHV